MRCSSHFGWLPWQQKVCSGDKKCTSASNHPLWHCFMMGCAPATLRGWVWTFKTSEKTYMMQAKWALNQRFMYTRTMPPSSKQNRITALFYEQGTALMHTNDCPWLRRIRSRAQHLIKNVVCSWQWWSQDLQWQQPLGPCTEKMRQAQT
jgi:hypothetical protein